ncbi:c-type cytochrome [bacterium]|jgi:putative membrane-bound dehydrogenase-like protein|nr:c-type cytochrome [bacterium]
MITPRFGQVAVIVFLLPFIHCEGIAQVELATDAPKPLTPEESARSFRVPEGFHVDLVAAEPLIQAPSGVCWDEHGRLYVSELHGYNLEGQYDIEALNETGELDRVVRRIQADELAKKKAESGTYGVIKRLKDTDGDGRMDQSSVFARQLPPCYGMVPACGGIIAACAPHIYFLSDTNGDGMADVREILFTGFEEGILERRINAPQWGLDNWIYFGGGGRVDHITGPYLEEPVSLGRTDFRIKADGSAIEAVGGHTATFGHTFTREGDRVTISTGTPGYQVIPLPWRYLKRNAELAIPSMERNAAAYQTTFPLAEPHPWRTRRYEDPGFSKYYTDHYGKAESVPSGYFTSACSPLIYRDTAFPENYWGSNFTCEPAQNLIHHSFARWDGPVLNFVRGGSRPDRESVEAWAAAERLKKDGALPSVGSWKQLGPLEGGDKNMLFEKDFGPEKKLDLEAKVNGLSWMEKKHYRDDDLIDLGLPENAAVYLHRTLSCKEAVSLYVSLGSNDAIKCWLNGELLLENNVNRSVAAGQETAALHLKKGVNSFLMKIVNGTNASGFYFNILPSLVPRDVRQVIQRETQEWSQAEFKIVESYVQSLRSEGADSEFLASTDSWFHPINLTHGPDGAIYISDYYREIIEDYSAIPRYLQQQYGLTNGKYHGRVWRLSHESDSEFLLTRMSHLPNGRLAMEVGSPRVWRRETARRLLIEREAKEVREPLGWLLEEGKTPDAAINALYTLDALGALRPDALLQALSHPHWAVRRHALTIGDAYPVGSRLKSTLGEWLFEISHYGQEPRLLLQLALSLGAFQDSEALDGLAYLADQHGSVRWMDIAIVSSSAGREAELLGQLLAKQSLGSRLAETLVATLATRAHRVQVIQAMTCVKKWASGSARDLYLRILEGSLATDDETVRFEIPAPELPNQESLQEIEAAFPRFEAALGNRGNSEQGQVLFAEHCASCHQAGGVGVQAGPDLDSEFQRAPETILRDILFPNEAITEGFETVRLEMRRGSDAMGLLASESPTSVTLRFPSGSDMTFLRKDIARIHTHPVSLMPAQFASLLEPDVVASIIAFLRHQRSE